MSYFERRKDLPYYSVVRRLLESYGRQSSLLDIGCHDTPVATWGHFDQRFTLDPKPRPSLLGVTQLVGRFPDEQWLLPPELTVITCLQLLEHIAEVREFCDAMFALATSRVIVSVPYCWSESACDVHLHDPIDEAKLLEMTGRKPVWSWVTGKQPERRLVVEYAME